MQHTTHQEAASAVTAYLTHGQGYGGRSELERLVQQRITTLAGELADEIVSSTPGLREAIERHTRDVVTRALQDDAGLRDSVVAAVARALAVRHEED